MRIGIIGLGHMGRAIAENLVREGHKLTVFNRTRAKADELGAKGAQVASSPQEAARAVEVLITMLSDDDAVASAVLGDDGAIHGLEKGAVHVSMSTISPEMSRRLASAHEAAGQDYVAAPVLGRPEAAERGKLVVIAAGPKKALVRCTSIFDALGRETHLLGEMPERANVVKLGANFILATLLEAIGEAYALVEPYGVKPTTFLDVLNGSLLKSDVIGDYGKRIAERDFQPAGFQLSLGLKDIRLALDAAESVSVPMPIASVLRDRFVAAMARGMRNADWSAIASAMPEARH